MEQKRISIRRRIQIIIFLMMIALIITIGAVVIMSMLHIKHNAEHVLVRRMEYNLSNTVHNKADFASAQFKRFTSYTATLQEYINDLYAHPENYSEREILPPNMDQKDVYTTKRYIADKSISYRELEKECKLLGNVENLFMPIIMQNSEEILAVYVSTESGIQISTDGDSDITANEDGSEVYFDYFERPWYKMAKEKNEISFTNVYEDTFKRGYMITCAAPIYDAENKFAGVVCIDMLIDNLYSTLVDFDVMEGEGDYAFLIDGNGYAVAPEYSGMNVKNDEKITDEISDKMLSGESGVALSSSSIYYAFAPIEGIDWTMCLHVPQKTVLAPVHDIDIMVQASIALLFFIFIFVAIFMTFMVRRFALSITEPLYALRQDANIISSGDLSHKAKVYYNDEVGDLAMSINNMAASLSDYVENLTAVTAEKERIGTELGVATQIQADMLPRIFPPFPEKKEFDLYATMDPAKYVGGDFYDFFLIDDDHLCMVMADVSGKGVPAALFMVIAKTLIKNRATMGGTPSEILSYTNEQLCEGNDAELFVTVWIGILEISTGKGIAANAGHEHPVIMRAGGDYELVKYRHSMAVATIPGIRFNEHEFELHPGDRLFVYTDGVPEATNADNVLFGDERMLEVLNSHKECTVKDILVEMKKSIDLFVGKAPQFDDITMLMLYYYGNEG
ncbi:MAG: SpoIIE family protein phosphatase [Butyrivibrio sp.]|nr:SpoIIE family protein phosphatase [Butyrivibrio sp.]